MGIPSDRVTLFLSVHSTRSSRGNGFFLTSIKSAYFAALFGEGTAVKAGAARDRLESPHSPS